MKKICLFLMAALVISVAQPRPAQADPLFLFAFTVITGGWGAATYEECKAEGIDLEECASKTWREREPLDYSKLND